MGKKAPRAYQPTWQGGADQTYQTIANGATPWVQNLPGSVIPGAQQVVNNVASNPYWLGAQTGANDVANMARNWAVPGMMGSASSLYDTGMSSLGQGQGMMDALRWSGDAAYAQGQDLAGRQRGFADTQGVLANRSLDMLPGAVNSGYANADPFYMSGMTKANKAWAQSQAMMPGMTQGMPYAQHMLDQGFDPRGELYGREYQKMRDQQNAISSMYGVSSSPYGAGLAGDASRNFNMDWQNEQLQRQMASLSGYNDFASGVTDRFSGLLNTGGNQYNQLSQGAVQGFNDLLNGSVQRGSTLMNDASRYTNAASGALENASVAMNRGVDNQRLGYGTGADIYNNMNQGGINALGAASAHGTDALNTLYTSTQLPSQTYLGQQQAQMTALMQMAQAAGLSLDPSSQLMQSLGNYMKLGQGATQLNQNAQQIDNARAAANMSGLASIAGVAIPALMTGGASLFGSLAAGAALGGGAAGAATGASPALGAIVSDRRLKRDAVKVGIWKGLGVYLYRYLNGMAWHVGVMAQDVLRAKPAAIVRMSNGYMAVNYGAL